MKNRFSFLVFAFFLGLSGCSTQPDEVKPSAVAHEWTGSIEDEPPVSIDDPQKEGNNWIWQDGKKTWAYRKSSPVIAEPVSWVYEAEALVFRFQSPQQLNMYMGKPHSLYLKVFQLSDTKVFKDIAKTPAGIRELLTSENIDSSILGSEELTIAPNKQENLVYDRFKETRFIAIVTGYYQMEPEKSVRIFEIPSVANRLDNTSFGFSSLNPFSEPGITEAARIKAWINLGVTKISRLQMLAQ